MRKDAVNFEAILVSGEALAAGFIQLNVFPMPPTASSLSLTARKVSASWADNPGSQILLQNQMARNSTVDPDWVGA